MRLNFHVPASEWVTFTVGDRVKFAEEKGPYTVRGVTMDGRYVICTKPFNPQRTCIYSVIDQARGIRGPDNYWSLGYETPEQIRESLAMFESGQAELSERRHIALHITEHKKSGGREGDGRTHDDMPHATPTVPRPAGTVPPNPPAEATP